MIFSFGKIVESIIDIRGKFFIFCKTAEELCLLFSIKCDPDAADFTVNINLHQLIQMKLNTTKNIHGKFLFSDFSCTQSCVLEILKLWLFELCLKWTWSLFEIVSRSFSVIWKRLSIYPKKTENPFN